MSDNGTWCNACTVTCPPGSLLDGECTPTSDKTCAPCDSLPPNAEYVEENSCEFECDEEFFRDGASCSPCTTECAFGFYLQSSPADLCTRARDILCTECPFTLPTFSFFTDEFCNFVCDPGYSLTSAAIPECIPCIRECGVGEELVGVCEGDGTPAPECVPCDNAPEGGRYIQMGGCAWKCGNGLYLFESECVPCTRECGEGQYLSGRCQPFATPVCLDCTNKVSNSEYSSNGTLDGNDCDFICDVRYSFNENANRCELCPVATDCNVGAYLNGTYSPTTCPVCAPCTNERGEGAEYVGSGGVVNACPLGCIDQYYLNVTLDACVLCDVEDSCNDAQMLIGMCTPTSNPTCEPCEGIPENAYPVGGDCAWLCRDGYHADVLGESCIACIEECTTDGFYLSGQCTQNSIATECMQCTNAPARTRYTSPGDPRENNCDFECTDELMYYNEAANRCLDCTVDADCAAGETVRGNCTSTNNPTCAPCARSTLPDDAMYTTPGSCEFLCVDGFFRELDECLPCTMECARGCYPSGECGGYTDYECLFCTNLEDDKYFLTAGTLNAPNSCRAADCVTDCDPGYSLSGECTWYSSPECVPCEVELLDNASFTIECSFACNEDYYFTSLVSGAMCARSARRSAGRGRFCFRHAHLRETARARRVRCLCRRGRSGRGGVSLSAWRVGIARRRGCARCARTRATVGSTFQDRAVGVSNYECSQCEGLGAEQYFTSEGSRLNDSGSCDISDCLAQCVGGNVLDGQCGGCSNRICEGAGGTRRTRRSRQCARSRATGRAMMDSASRTTGRGAIRALRRAPRVASGWSVHTHVGQDLCGVRLASPECGVCGGEFV